MLNSKAFKKLAALTAAVALVGSFAVSASAIKVNTTTKYVAGSNEDKITVSVNVTEATPNSEVTYYAIDAGALTPYHVDQATADGAGVAEFESFVTPATKLNAKVLVNGAEDEITGRTISVVKGSADVTVIPTEETSATVTITPALTSGYVVDEITVEGATKSTPVENGDGTWTLSLSAFTADVVITVTEKESVVAPTPVAKFIDSGWVAEGNGFKITVLGSVKDLAEGGKFGAKINDTEYESKAVYSEGEKYFAIQLISDTLEIGDYVTTVYATGAADATSETLKVQ